MTASGPGADWIARANDRHLGTTELRCVTMMISGAKGGRSLELRTLRQLDGSVCRTLFCVMEPRMFRGVSYVAEEVRGRFEMDITLYLPYVVGTVRQVPPKRCGQTFLGSDFSYDDMRTWLPESGFNYDAPVTSADAIRIRGCRVDTRLTWRHGGEPFVVLLDPRTAFVVGIDYLDDAGRAVRTMRVPARTRRDGIEIPAEIDMSTEGTSTALFLQQARLDLEVDAFVFAKGHCGRRYDYIAGL